MGRDAPPGAPLDIARCTSCRLRPTALSVAHEVVGEALLPSTERDLRDPRLVCDALDCDAAVGFVLLRHVGLGMGRVLRFQEDEVRSRRILDVAGDLEGREGKAAGRSCACTRRLLRGPCDRRPTEPGLGLRCDLCPVGGSAPRRRFLRPLGRFDADRGASSWGPRSAHPHAVRATSAITPFRRHSQRRVVCARGTGVSLRAGQAREEAGLEAARPATDA